MEQQEQVNDIEDVSLEEAIEAGVEAPAEVDQGKKKGKWGAMKMGAGAVGVALLVLVLLSVFSGPEKTTGSARTSTLPSDAGSFDRTRAGDASTNPEAERIKQEALKMEAEKNEKKGGTFLAADPFGSESKNKDKDEGLDERARKANQGGVTPIETNFPPPPPPPSMEKESGGNGGRNEQSPEDMMVSNIRASLFRVAKPSVSLGPEPRPTDIVSSMAPNGQMDNPAQKEYAIRAGDLLHAQLTSGLNSLVPETPARAIIRSGKWRNAILLGRVSVRDNKYIVIQFNSMSFGKTTYGIQAVAVSAETGQAGLADEVNSRFTERYALMAGMGFLQAVGASIMTEGQTSTQTVGAGGTIIQQTNPTKSTAQTAMVGIGGAAQALAPAAQEIQSGMKPEVIIYPGKDIGVMFTQPFSPDDKQQQTIAAPSPVTNNPLNSVGGTVNMNKPSVSIGGGSVKVGGSAGMPSSDR